MMNTKNPYWFYIATSFAFGGLVTLLSLYTSPNGWSDFYNSRPERGEMGFGRFLIRGTRYVDGNYTPFAYPWRTVEPSQVGRVIGWIAYIIHQLGQWIILSQVKLSKKIVKWSEDYQWWNWSMVYLNGGMMLFKLIHGHLFYDGLAVDVPEGVAQGSVVLILVLAIVLAIPYRGVLFGHNKSPANDRVIVFVRKYHGYVMSFGTVGNFHYHPVEGTMAHLFGFIYQCLLIWQSTNFLHKSHRNKSWVLLLESWVFIHGTLTALIQPGIGWQIFSYGFMVIFLVNQIYQTKISQNRIAMALIYSAFFVWAYWGLNKEMAYYRAILIPITEYLFVYLILWAGQLTCYLGDKIPKFKVSIVLSTSICVSIGLTVGLALILAGNLKVYNDY